LVPKQAGTPRDETGIELSAAMRSSNTIVQRARLLAFFSTAGA
jgi:hypothetical protein